MAVQHFDPEPRAALEARRFARSVLEPYGDAWQTAELLVSELATNVIKHASTRFVVEVTVLGQVARVGVSDGVAVELAVMDAAEDASSGRGLHLLDSLASSWGVDLGSGGKCVWFEVPLGGDGSPAA
ncbi:MAG: ATP-binding protein [Actinomycetota bacterium]|nr:ATP-binding protein [Actinomycetota bacterium]